MRRTTLALALAMLPACASLLAAQERDTTLRRANLPRDVRADVETLFNSSTVALRAHERVEIEEGRVIRGDVAVQNGPLMIAGQVTGRVVAVNADVILRPTARIEGDLLVVGGEVTGRESAFVGGETRIYREPMRRRAGEQRAAEDETRRTRRDEDDEEESWWERIGRRRREDRSWSKLQIASAGAYNRVEGLPVNLGPQIYQRFPWGSARLDAYAIVRTSSSFSAHENDVGHNVRAELRLGRLDGLALGGRAFNVIDPVEAWQLKDAEVGLASFLAHRDYRDYYQRHGASGWGELFIRQGVSLTASYSNERWGSRSSHDPFTLFRNAADWRPNPLVDEGRMHVGMGELKIDTRNDRLNPWSGWFVVADWERGAGTLREMLPPIVSRTPSTRHADYTRGFVDLRRYNRLSPDAQLNVRLVLGGWLDGDQLPMERRLSVDGPGALPGFGFRTPRAGADVGTCNADGRFPGRPAVCDRVALAQVEWRSDLHFDFGSDWDWDDDAAPTTRRAAHRAHGRRFHNEGVWVVFADAGRGWLVGRPLANDPAAPLYYKRDELPALSTFRTDLGAGLDFGVIGFYASKAVSTAGEPIRLFVRLHHRF